MRALMELAAGVGAPLWLFEGAVACAHTAKQTSCGGDVIEANAGADCGGGCAGGCGATGEKLGYEEECLHVTGCPPRRPRRDLGGAHHDGRHRGSATGSRLT